jgi:hypothetical protein
MRAAVLAISFLSASALSAQKVATIDPGMSRDDVVKSLGQPLSSKSYDGYTYMLYHNGCEKKCGMNDLVVLDSGKVVDAVFRSANRKYRGESSSPKMISAVDAKHASSSGKPLAVPSSPPKKPSST